MFRNEAPKKMEQAKYVVITTIPVKKEKLEEVLKLVKATFPRLIQNQPDWENITISFDEDKGKVSLQSYWQKAISFQAFRQSKPYQNTMKLFEKYLQGIPEITVNKILTAL